MDRCFIVPVNLTHARHVWEVHQRDARRSLFPGCRTIERSISKQSTCGNCQTPVGYFQMLARNLVNVHAYKKMHGLNNGLQLESNTPRCIFPFHKHSHTSAFAEAVDECKSGWHSRAKSLFVGASCWLLPVSGHFFFVCCPLALGFVLHSSRGQVWRRTFFPGHRGSFC